MLADEELLVADQVTKTRPAVSEEDTAVNTVLGVLGLETDFFRQIRFYNL